MSIHWSKSVTNTTDIATAAEQGFRYIQPPVSMITAMQTAPFEALLQQLQDLRLQALVCNDLLPAEVIVTDPGFNHFTWVQYTKKALGRVAQMGCQAVAWDHGKSRLLPWEGSHVFALKEQLDRFLYIICEQAANYGIQVLVEPMSSERTNYLTSMSDIEALLHCVGADNLQAQISFRDWFALQDGHDAIYQHTAMLQSINLENPSIASKRQPPAATDSFSDGFSYATALDKLISAGFSGSINLPTSADQDTLRFCQSLVAYPLD